MVPDEPCPTGDNVTTETGLPTMYVGRTTGDPAMGDTVTAGGEVFLPVLSVDLPAEAVATADTVVAGNTTVDANLIAWPDESSVLGPELY